MAEIAQTPLPGVFLIAPVFHRDSRGYFVESYRKSWLADFGVDDEFVQHNRSSSTRHVLRGLHYQVSRPQAKLVQVIHGAVWDIVVDLRRGSRTFGQWFGAELSDRDHRLMYIPKGCAHGFFVLSDTAEFHYLCSDYYCPGAERGIRWDCRRLRIDWRIPAGATPILSGKDNGHPGLDEVGQDDLPKD